MVEARGLTKRFGSVVAVDRLSFRVPPGAITGFLGPNGAGKTTTLRMLLGLVRPDEGTATIGGVAYRRLEHPLRRVGAVLEASSFHPGRSGRNHLRVLAAAGGLEDSRADAVLALVELDADGKRKVKGYSLGMRQRLSLAAAMLGDPGILILDEPANGLDPAGIRWLRGFLRSLADEGRTILVSSHVLAEVEQLADEVVIVHRGRFVAQAPVREVVARAAGRVRVRTPDPVRLAELLRAAGLGATAAGDNSLTVADATSAKVGELAAANGVVLHELVTETSTLEEAFLELTSGDVAR